MDKIEGVIEYVEMAMDEGFLFYNSKNREYYDSLAGVVIKEDEMVDFLEEMAGCDEWYDKLCNEQYEFITERKRIFDNKK